MLAKPAGTYVDDGRTAMEGFLSKRTSFTRLIQDTALGLFDVVVIVDMDRLTRSEDLLREGGPSSQPDLADHRGDPADITDYLDEHVETILAYLAGNRNDLLHKQGRYLAVPQGPGPELVDVPLDLVTELGSKVARVNASIEAGNVGELRKVLDGLAWA
jgi:hypothetical protein